MALAARLAQEPVEQALPGLLDLLEDESWRVRSAAVEALSALQPAAEIVERILERLLAHPDVGHRNAAFSALSRMGRPAVFALMGLLKDAAEDLRKFAVDALGVMGDPVCAPSVAEALRDPDANVRAAAAEALGRVGGAAAASALRARLDPNPPTDPLELSCVLGGLARLRETVPFDRLVRFVADPMTRASALALAVHCTEAEAVTTVAEALAGRSASAREACVRALLGAGPRSPVAQALMAQPERRGVILRAAEALLDAREEDTALAGAAVAAWVATPETASLLLRRRRGRPWDVVIAQALESGGVDARLEVARSLAEMEPEDQALALDLLAERPDARTAPFLQSLCQHAVGELLEGAAGALLGADPGAAVTPLVARLVDPLCEPEDAGVVERALLQLVAGHAAALREALRPTVERGGEGLARAAAVLAQTATVDDVALLKGWLRGPDPILRTAACQGLSRVGAPEDAELLLHALSDESATVRRAAALGLPTLGGPAAALALAARVQDDDATVMGAALHGLSLISPARAAELALWKVSNPLPRVAEVALEAAERMGGVTALAAGARAMGSDELTVVRAALRALAASGLPQAAALTIPLLKDPRWEVRHAAAQALGKLMSSHAAPEDTRARIQETASAERNSLVKEALQYALDGGTAENAC
ncbi:MAG: HEAT repeat domain-containing protein [Myxococcota bacterium]